MIRGASSSANVSPPAIALRGSDQLQKNAARRTSRRVLGNICLLKHFVAHLLLIAQIVCAF
jgi:hypothetical protein